MGLCIGTLGLAGLFYWFILQCLRLCLKSCLTPHRGARDMSSSTGRFPTVDSLTIPIIHAWCPRFAPPFWALTWAQEYSSGCPASLLFTVSRCPLRFDLHYPSLPLHAVPVATSLPFSGFKAKRRFSGFLCRCRSLTEKTISGSPLHKKGRLAAAHVFPDG